MQWWEVVLDALKDTAILLPFLLVLYILIEVMEHNTKVGKPRRAFSGKWAPALGAVTGLVPMCGFSVMASKLWQHRHITIGTLIAVFIATSDEALIVLLFSQEAWTNHPWAILALIGSKLVLGITVGYVLDLFVRKRPTPIAEGAHEGHHHHHEHHHEEKHEDHEGEGCECAELSPCEHKKESKAMLYFVSPLLHALQVAAFVFVVNLAFGFLIFGIGEDKVIGFLQGAGYWYQPLVCALVGAIPNCASSVVLAEVFALGGIGFGGLLGGLVVNAGLGYVILFKKGSWKQGLLILAGMIVFGVAIGYCANAVGLAFL